MPSLPTAAPPPQYSDAMRSSTSPHVVDVTPSDDDSSLDGYTVEIETPPTDAGKFHGYIFCLPVGFWTIYGQRGVRKNCYTIYNIKQQIAIWFLGFLVIIGIILAIIRLVDPSPRRSYQKKVCQTYRPPGSSWQHVRCDTITIPYTQRQMKNSESIWNIVVCTFGVIGIIAMCLLICLYIRQARIKREQAKLEWNVTSIPIDPEV